MLPLLLPMLLHYGCYYTPTVTHSYCCCYYFRHCCHCCHYHRPAAHPQRTTHNKQQPGNKNIKTTTHTRLANRSVEPVAVASLGFGAHPDIQTEMKHGEAETGQVTQAQINRFKKPRVACAETPILPLGAGDLAQPVQRRQHAVQRAVGDASGARSGRSRF